MAVKKFTQPYYLWRRDYNYLRDTGTGVTMVWEVAIPGV